MPYLAVLIPNLWKKYIKKKIGRLQQYVLMHGQQVRRFNVYDSLNRREYWRQHYLSYMGTSIWLPQSVCLPSTNPVLILILYVWGCSQYIMVDFSKIIAMELECILMRLSCLCNESISVRTCNKGCYLLIRDVNNMVVSQWLCKQLIKGLVIVLLSPTMYKLEDSSIEGMIFQICKRLVNRTLPLL